MSWGGLYYGEAFTILRFSAHLTKEDIIFMFPISGGIYSDWFLEKVQPIPDVCKSKLTIDMVTTIAALHLGILGRPRPSLAPTYEEVDVILKLEDYGTQGVLDAFMAKAWTNASNGEDGPHPGDAFRRQTLELDNVGGMTQYMAKVQGMPTEIEEKLERRVRSFLWAEKSQVRINKETVYAQSDVGGKNLLDIIARNEAIAITWLKTYLSFGPDRPLWCFVADEILAKKAVGGDFNADEAM
ncbi:hypothetical protein DFH07DRAFT_949069 [Mycena maculata]|uniref:Uncharacterized protein n=1 Tax=Mycena maculata TaxID=230809 RepID=A0AAD7KD55_9AGAR|nr:hypothetical protein DFH07DRAFT_949069 [Mycena maculata]